MTLRLARTNAEAHIYMELQPCDACGETGFDPGSSTLIYEGDLASRYEGSCPRCGNVRTFLFRIPEEPVLPDEDEDEPDFGGEEPSELIDAGEWMWLADLVAASSPAEPDSLDDDVRQTVLIDLRIAAAAVSEVMKFLPPEADTVPLNSFWTDRGRAAYSEQPGRFSRGRLEVVRNTYRDLAARFAG
jgi:hypothetical protein